MHFMSKRQTFIMTFMLFFIPKIRFCFKYDILQMMPVLVCQAAITKYHRLGSLNNRHSFLAVQQLKVQGQMLAGLVSPKASPRLAHSHLLTVLPWPLLCVLRPLITLPLLLRTQSCIPLLYQVPILSSQCLEILITSSKVLSPNTVRCVSGPQHRHFG